MVVSHFSDYDDLFVPYLYLVIGNYDIPYFRDQFINYGGIIATMPMQWMYDLFNQFPSFFDAFKRIILPIIMSKNSTSAPLQFFITSLTLDLNTSYTHSLLTSRIPSSIFSIMTLYILHLFSKEFNKEDRVYLFLVGASILTFSWMFLIYSSQSEVYAAPVFAVMSLFLIFIKNYKHTLSIIRSLWVGVLLILLCLTSYQVLFFLPGFFIALFYSFRFSIKRFMSSWLFAGLITILGVYIIYLLFFSQLNSTRSSIGISWNSGPNSEYLFDAFNSCDRLESFRCLYIFFKNNTFDVFRSILSFSDIDTLVSKVYTVIIFLLSIVGLIYLFLKKSEHYKEILVFILVNIITWTVLVYFQLIAFSPTRHSLVLLVPIIILTSFGILGIRSIVSEKYYNFFPYFFYACILYLLTIYLFNFEGQKQKRIDPFQKIDFISIVKSYNVTKIITYDETLNVFLYPEINAKFDYEFFGDHYLSPNVLTQKNSTDKDDAIMIVSYKDEISVHDASNDLLPMFKDYPLDSYQLIYSYKFQSDTQSSFGDLAKSGSNNLFINIYSPHSLEFCEEYEMLCYKF